MNNATIILMIGVFYAVLFSPWWVGLIAGLIVGLVSCILVDGVWWLMRKLAHDHHRARAGEEDG